MRVSEITKKDYVNKCRLEKIEAIMELFNTLGLSRIRPTSEAYRILMDIKCIGRILSLQKIIEDGIYAIYDGRLSNDQVAEFLDLIFNNLTLEGLKNEEAVSTLVYSMRINQLAPFHLPIVKRLVEIESADLALKISEAVSHEDRWSEEITQLYCEWLDGCRGVELHIVPKLISTMAFLEKADWFTGREEFIKSIETRNSIAIKAALVAEELYAFSSDKTPSLDFYQFFLDNLEPDYNIVETNIKEFKALRQELISRNELGESQSSLQKTYPTIETPQKQMELTPLGRYFCLDSKKSTV